MSEARKDQLIHLKSAPPLRAEIGAFLVDREARGLSERTLEFYRAELSYFHSWVTKQAAMQKVTDITPDLLRRWLLELSKTRNSGGIHASYRTPRAFLRWSWEENECSSLCPIRKVKPPRLGQEPLEPLSLDILEVMLATCDRKSLAGCRDRALLLPLLDTGCRASEFLSLNLGDINLVSGAVLIRCGKGSKTRVTFLGARSKREVVRYLRRRCEMSLDAPLWATIQDVPMTYSGLRQVLRRHANTAGVAEPSLHSFRRAFALLSLRNGADVCSLQRLMGHSDIAVLQRYLKQTEADLQAVHRKTAPVDNSL